MCRLSDAVLRMLLNGFNIFLVLGGLLLLGLCTAAESSSSEVSMASFTTPVFMLAAIFIVLAIIGCVASCSGVKFLLKIYVFAVIVVGVMTMSVGLILLCVHKAAQEWAEKTVEDNYKNSDTNDEAFETINSMQRTYKCCGFINADDRYLYPRGVMSLQLGSMDNAEMSKDLVIGSCCGKTFGVCSKRDTYAVGCKKAVGTYMRDIVLGIAGSLTTLGLVEVVIGVITYRSVKKPEAEPAAGAAPRPGAGAKPEAT